MGNISRRSFWTVCVILAAAFVGGLFIVLSGENADAKSRIARSIGKGDCGAYSLTYACEILGIRSTVGDLRQKLGIPAENSTTFAQLKNVAEQLGCQVDPVLAKPNSLETINFPAIAFVDGNHFLTLAGLSVDKSQLLVLDGPGKPQWVSMGEFSQRWTGELLLLSKKQPVETLWLGGESIDIGTFKGVNPETVEVGISNPTSWAVRVENVAFSCPCASNGRVDPPIIPPGTAARLIFQINPAVKPLGSFSLKMFVKTDMPARPGNIVTIHARAALDYEVKPAFFSVGDISADEPERELLTRVRFPRGRTPDFTPVAIGQGMSLKSSQLVGFGEYELRLGFTAKEIEAQPGGAFLTRIVLLPDKPLPATEPSTTAAGKSADSDHSDHFHPVTSRAFAVDVTGRIVPPIYFLPDSFYGGVVQKEQQLSGRVKVQRSSKESLQITNKGNGIREAELNGQWLDFKFQAPNHPGLFTSTIELTMGQRRISLPIYAFVRD